MEKLSCDHIVQEQMDKREGARHLANFQPDLWGDTFLECTLLDEVAENQRKREVNELKELVRTELTADGKDPKEKLMYIDAIERLGVAYHFEDEIEAILLKFHTTNVHSKDDDSYKNDLHYVSLRFRILRQHGFHVPSDVFDVFINEDGRFKESFTTDVQGMLSLYEAGHLRVHGEDILDEALAYTRPRLESFADDSYCAMATQVARALKLPLFKRSPRLESTYQISTYESDPSCNAMLLRLSILDFNTLQVLHRNELRDIIRWSKSLGFTTKVPFSRDRIVEAYFYILGVYYEPKYSRSRVFFNKLFKLLSIVDDTYDAYGTNHELKLFTNAIQRWDKSCISELPDYMKFIYEVVLDTFEQFEKELAEEGRAYAVNYLRQEMKAVCQTYMQEAKWCHENYVPSFDEYMKNGIGSSAFFLVATACFLGMGAVANEDVFKWIHGSSMAPEASCKIARNVNDIAGHKVEQSRGHVASAVECYMKQFGVTQEEAYEQLLLLIEEAWKDIKQETLRPTAIPMTVLTRFVNMSRALYDFYDTREDGYTNNRHLQPKVELLLRTPAM